MTLQIRSVIAEDLPELRSIYAYYVNHSTATFDEQVPSSNQFEHDWASIAQAYPYLVAVDDQQQCLGYCFAHAYSSRSAYQWSVEVTIYLSPSARGQHVGTALYQALEAALKAQHIINVFACITADNHASRAFHEKLGYQQVGYFKASGFKCQRWLDTVYLQKQLQTPSPAPLPFQPIN